LLGDDLYAHQPFCRQVLLHGFHFLFTCKPASHATLQQWVEGLEAGRQLHSLKLRVKGKSNRWEHHFYRWANGVPFTDSDDALKVNLSSLLAFGLHTLLELADQSYRLIRATLGPRRWFFQPWEALTSYLHFESWERLMDFMMRGLEIGPYAVQKS
jgi:hypothetical protein